MIVGVLIALAGAALCFGGGWLACMMRSRPPAVPSAAYFLERDWEPADETEQLRRTVRAAIMDWQQAYGDRPPW